MSEAAARILQHAVTGIGGGERSGQQAMATAIAQALGEGTHLLVQAGTGTGKSLGYLAPALARIVEHAETIVVATATLALQTQLATSDIPAALDAVEAVTGTRPRAAVLKGRNNYACLYRARDGVREEGQGTLLGAAELQEPRQGDNSPSTLGIEVLALREWVEEQLLVDGAADRDDAPTHTAAAWQQVSIPTRECPGAARCPFGQECFVEKSRETARTADLIITNHALVAINAMHGGTALPEYAALIIDEAHELTGRLTTAATGELRSGLVERVVRRCLTWLDDDLGGDLLDVVEEFLDMVEMSRCFIRILCLCRCTVGDAVDRRRDLACSVRRVLGGRRQLLARSCDRLRTAVDLSDDAAQTLCHCTAGTRHAADFVIAIEVGGKVRVLFGTHIQCGKTLDHSRETFEGL